jgi:asparagine N-glycosylation enzyme membrane subunit Stt3
MNTILSKIDAFSKNNTSYMKAIGFVLIFLFMVFGIYVITSEKSTETLILGSFLVFLSVRFSFILGGYCALSDLQANLDNDSVDEK